MHKYMTAMYICILKINCSVLCSFQSYLGWDVSVKGASVSKGMKTLISIRSRTISFLDKSTIVYVVITLKNQSGYKIDADKSLKAELTYL